MLLIYFYPVHSVDSMRKQDDSFQTNLLVFHPRMVVEPMDYHNNLDYERVALVLEIVQHINYYLNRSVSDYSMDSADNYSMVVEYQDFGLSHQQAVVDDDLHDLEFMVDGE